MLVTLKNLSAVLEKLSPPRERALDTETTGLRPHHGDRLFSLIIADDRDSAYYFNFQRYPGVEPLPRGVLEQLKAPLAAPGNTWFLHNAKFDLAMLRMDNIELGGTIHCTEAIGRVERNNRIRYGLDVLAAEIGYGKDKAVEEYIKKHKLYEMVEDENGELEKKPLFKNVPFEIMQPYGEKDACITYELGRHQILKIETAGGPKPLARVMQNERELTRTVFEMEWRGIKIDTTFAKKARNFEAAREEKASSEFERIAEEALGKPMKFVDSAKCFAPVFDALGELYPLTEKGNPSFAAEALDGMKTPLAGLILEFRDARKRRTAYYENFLYYADQFGIIHPNIRQAGAKTGRVSIANPSLQNLSKSAEKDNVSGFLVRGAFIPRPGFFFLMPDYDQMEYRLMLDYAGEMGLIEQVLNGLDVHQATANLMGVERHPAKTINFMLLYGGGIAKLAAALFNTTLDLETLQGIGRIYIYKMRTYPERKRHEQLIARVPKNVLDHNLNELLKAHALMEKYYSALPKVKEFTKNVQKVAKDRGHILNWLGRRSYFGPGVPTHKAPNYLIQGGCADVVKLAMIRIDALLQGKKSRMLLQIHDELLFEIHDSEEYLAEPIKKIMEEAYTPRHLPLTCGLDYSRESWSAKLEWNGRAI
jgi:DNA polymerase-1